MRKSKYPVITRPGEEPVGKKPPKPPKHGDPHDRKEKKKKKKHHLILWIIFLVFLVGILLGLLIDKGLFFPGGQGWIGGVVDQVTGNNSGSKQQPTSAPIDINGTITPNPSPVPTQPVNESAAKVYIRVSGDKIYMNDYQLSPEDLLAQLGTDTYKSSIIYITNDNATKAVMDNLRTLLRNAGREFVE